MLRWALLALLAVPLADMALLLYVAGVIGAVPTVAIVVLTGLVGLMLVRAEGRHTIRRVQEKLVRGEPPTDELLDGGLLIAAGAFLLTPGLVTDTIGFLFVLPPTRYVARTLLKRYVVVPRLDERTDGFVTGDVYTVGFPSGGSGDADSADEEGVGSMGNVHDLGEADFDVDLGEEDYDVDLGDDAYDIDLDEDEESNGNA